MLFGRRLQFLMTKLGLGGGATPAAEGATAARPAPAKSALPSGAGTSSIFFRSPDFEFLAQIALGRTQAGAGDVGRTLYLFSQIKDGDHDSAFDVFRGAGDAAKADAEARLAAGHRESARFLYLAAQNYYDAAGYFADGSSDPSRFEPTWELLYDCFVAAAPLFSPAIEPVLIPYEGTQLRGFHFRSASTAPQRPLLILVNGSDGSVLDMWGQGAMAGIARGYDCLTFDGPGQGYALWKQNLHFRPDWEKVIGPVIDFALTLPGIDPKRIAVQGVSQGGYWAPRAAAFEKRIAAVVADPGVVDVSTSWSGHLPGPFRAMLDGGHKLEFDTAMATMLPAAIKASIAFRMRPFGYASYYDAFRATEAYNLTEIAGQITCPVLITEPADEGFWPGQAQQLYDLVKAPKTLVRFSAAEGASLHCEPMAPGLRNVRIFDWLDETLKA